MKATLIHSFEDPCTPPFQAAGDGCYYYSLDIGITVDFYCAAESLCNDTGGHLAVVDTAEENTVIKERFLGSNGKCIDLYFRINIAFILLIFI